MLHLRCQYQLSPFNHCQCNSWMSLRLNNNDKKHESLQWLKHFPYTSSMSCQRNKYSNSRKKWRCKQTQSKAVFRGCMDAKSDKTLNFRWLFASCCSVKGVTVGIPTFLPMLAKQRNLHCICLLQFPVWNSPQCRCGHITPYLFSFHYISFPFCSNKKKKSTNIQTCPNTLWNTFRNIHVEWKMRQ